MAKPTTVEMVACEICLKEVPLSEAVIPEAEDYVAHFCGLECYNQWKTHTKKAKKTTKWSDKTK